MIASKRPHCNIALHGIATKKVSLLSNIALGHVEEETDVGLGRSRSWSRSRFFQAGVGVNELWSTPQHCLFLYCTRRLREVGSLMCFWHDVELKKCDPAAEVGVALIESAFPLLRFLRTL